MPKPNKFTEMSLKGLKSVATSGYHALYVSEVFSVSDVQNCEAALSELNRRGYEQVVETKVVVTYRKVKRA